MRTNDYHSRGYVALMAVLVLGAVTTAIALTLLVTGVSSQKAALAGLQAAQARKLSEACASEALQVIHDTTSYTGTGTLILGQGSCSYTVSSTGSSTRTVAITGTVKNVVKKLDVRVTINLSNISVTSYQEVP